MQFRTLVRSIFAALGVTTLAIPAAQASVVLDVRPVQPLLEASDRPQRATLKISLEGIAQPSSSERGPVNMVLVLDRSGSMQGDKIENLRRAALGVVDRMGSRDVISVVAYDTREEVLIPAMPVRDKETIRRKIRSIQADGSTALFAGVSKGLAQARIYRGGGRATRVVLLSDGQANIGPSSPSQLAALGRSAAREGIPVTTVGLGLGYNEDLMSQLAQASDGNHDFAAEPTDLVRIFDRELGDAQDVVASDIVVKFHCPDNVRLIRVIDQDAQIDGQDLTMRWSQISGGQKRYILVEVEVPGSREGMRLSLGRPRPTSRIAPPVHPASSPEVSRWDSPAAARRPWRRSIGRPRWPWCGPWPTRTSGRPCSCATQETRRPPKRCSAPTRWCSARPPRNSRTTN